MAYTLVREVQTGDYWSALDVNRYIRDNFAAGVPDLMQAKGDMVVASGENAGVRLPVGIDGSYYWADSGAEGGVSSSPPARLSVKPSGADSELARLAWTAIPFFLSENFDIANAYAGGIFTVPHSGFFVIGLGMAYVHNGGSSGSTSPPYYLAVGLKKNTVFHSCLGLVDMTDVPNISGYKVQVYGCDILSLAKGDAIQPVYFINRNFSLHPYCDTTATLTRFELAPLI